MASLNGADTTPVPTQGWYRHYKGGTYWVEGVGTHSETGEMLVIYHDVSGTYYVRPVAMWFDPVEDEEGQNTRFAKIESGV